MAGQEIRETLYCWDISCGDLKVYVASSKRGGRRVGLSLKGSKDCMDYFRESYPRARLLRDEAMNRPMIEAIEAVMTNRGKGKDLPLDIRATPFQQEVWQAMERIPFGTTMTYGEMAKALGRPNASRAVGQAAGKNPLPLIFP